MKERPMKKYILASTFLIAFFLAACSRENPLAKADLDKVSYWLYQKKTPAIEACGTVWADKTTAKTDDLKVCEIVAAQLAKILTDGGFGKILPEDVSLPELWISFNERLRTSKANTYDKNEAQKAFGDKW
jgi:hypothetical protein